MNFPLYNCVTGIAALANWGLPYAAAVQDLVALANRRAALTGCSSDVALTRTVRERCAAQLVFTALVLATVASVVGLARMGTAPDYILGALALAPGGTLLVVSVWARRLRDRMGRKLDT